MYKKLGVFYGTFDPIHKGHTRLAQTVLKALSLDKVLIVPLKDVPHKKDKVVFDIEDRVAMCKLAEEVGVETSPVMAMFDVEGYDMQMIQLIKTLYKPETFYYILGSDVFKHILSWDMLHELIGQVVFVVALRDHQDDKVVNSVTKELEALGGRVELVEMPVMTISSTKIKRALDLKEHPTDLNASVKAYILDYFNMEPKKEA